MMCFIFSVAVVCLALAGLCLMVGWKSGASKLARVSFALVIGSAIASWFVDLCRAWVRQTSIQAVAGGVLILLVIVALVCTVVWFLKQRASGTEKLRPTIRRRAPLMEEGERPPALPSSAAPSSTDDLHLFGGSR